MFFWLKKFIARLADSNKKEFGGAKLDCCIVNASTEAERKRCAGRIES